MSTAAHAPEPKTQSCLEPVHFETVALRTNETHITSLRRSLLRRSKRRCLKNPKRGLKNPKWYTIHPFRDHHSGSHYGVAEHMQPLGEAPNARVKARVKPDGGRKSMLGKGAAGLGGDAQETPDGTPAPPSAPQPTMEQSPAPKIVVEDEDDGDYAPNGTNKTKERAANPRAARRSSGLPAITGTAQRKGGKGKRYFPKADPDGKIKEVVEEAKRRAVEVGKPDLAAAV